MRTLNRFGAGAEALVGNKTWGSVKGEDWGGTVHKQRCLSLSSNDFTLWRLSISWFNAAGFTCTCSPSIIHPLHLHHSFGQVNFPGWMVGQASGFGRNQLGGPETNREDPDNLAHCNWIQLYRRPVVYFSLPLCNTQYPSLALEHSGSGTFVTVCTKNGPDFQIAFIKHYFQYDSFAKSPKVGTQKYTVTCRLQ